jgi:Ribonuclease P 40kDa (Rpp40) subunit
MIASLLDGGQRANTLQGHLFPGVPQVGMGNVVSAEGGAWWMREVEESVDACRRLVECGSRAWAAVSVWGHKDAAVPWLHAADWCHEHAQNDYLLLILPQTKHYVPFVASGAGDTFRRFV